MASISDILQFASDNACFVTAHIASVCILEAISGTTPPNILCFSICVATTEETIFLPFSTTAAAVSSQELSIPRINIKPPHSIKKTDVQLFLINILSLSTHLHADFRKSFS